MVYVTQLFSWLDNTLAALLRLLIRGYQRWLSPFLGAQCRFHPTCSCYADEALCVHGGVKGLGLSVYRILRCQPLSRGGFDPVPNVKTEG